MQLFTICFCNIFAPKKTKKPNQSTKQKKVKARRAPKKKRKRKRKISKKRITMKT